ncbi:site-specific DNA-methyltransferase [bacterium]|nr:site-specific DNA-methyltransferase [bacterium]MBU1873307.1 site-specific DNA-methyltransferase [bacterium]
MTELIWQGKYDKDGKKNGPVRIALPFQTVETVNESAQDRGRMLDLFAKGKPGEWRNRLIWGDKKYVLPSLLPEFAGKVNLIYIDPPFNVGADFSFTATIPDNPETEEDETTSFTKQASIIEQKAYRDTWGKGLESYLQWFYETAILLRELLAEDGSIYVHLDWHVGHYAKAVLDEVFGYDNFKNEVVWQRFNYHADAKRYGIVHEGILFYTKTEKYIWNPQRTSFKESYIRSHFNQKDKDGRNYRYDNMLAKGDGPARKFGNKLISPNPGTHWRYSQEKIDELWKQDKLIISDSDRVSVKRYLDEIDGAVIHSIWTDINPLNSQAIERIDYPTQKPEALLERVIKASSNENDLVLDCFCGSGTTAAAADKLNRRWIACDLGRFAIHTTRKRLLGNPDVKPFVVQNLGKYERQEWMGAEFPDADSRAAVEQRYRHFMLQLFGAEPVNGYSWLHGVKAHRMVHIGGVDAPVSIGDVKSIVQEFWKSVGKTGDIETNGIDVLGWDFAFEINETARQFAAENKVDVKFKKIPREVLEKKAVDQGDIRFFELASLAVDTKIDKETVTVELTNFIVPPDDVPEDVRHAITHWQQWIDYWAVDWNYRNDTFHNEWQSYRTKKEPGIELSTRHKYKESGTYNIVIKIIDILGNDTTKLITVEIKL